MLRQIFNLLSPTNMTRLEEENFAFLSSDSNKTISQLNYLKIKLFSIKQLTLTNSTTLQNIGDALIGTIEIGEPDVSLIKQGSSFIELAIYSVPDTQFYSAYCRGAVYSGYPLGTHVYAHFNLDSPFTQLPSDSVNQILKIFDLKNIKYRTEQIIISKPAKIFLPSVDQLEPLYIYFQNRYGKIYTATLQPYQLYRQLPSGEYELLIQQQLGHLYYVAFGSTVFDTYYIGFDFQNESVQIVEKAQKKKHLTLEEIIASNKKLVQNIIFCMNISFLQPKVKALYFVMSQPQIFK
ncbi:hypothetical protein ABPG72_006464 [Tetrahymena utriculariae]